MSEHDCCPNETCFDCRFWNEKVAWVANGDTVPARLPSDPDDRVARADGWHYVIRPMDLATPQQYLGFGGRLFTFRFTDGSEVASNNVMCQGQIPARWRDRLPDNAVLVPSEPRPTTIPFGPTEGLETDARILARMRARRAARLNAPPTQYHATTRWAPDPGGESADQYCADCGTSACFQWNRIHDRLQLRRQGLRRWPRQFEGLGPGWGSEPWLF